MRAIDFPESTHLFGKDQDQYNTLPAHIFKEDRTGKIAFCWKLTLKERISVLFGGCIWQQVLTFHQPLQPQLLSVEKPDFPITDGE